MLQTPVARANFKQK